jgi:hypothetical protein
MVPQLLLVTQNSEQLTLRPVLIHFPVLPLWAVSTETSWEIKDRFFTSNISFFFSFFLFF